LTSSPSITYLENSSATIYLKGPKTCFKIFGSPSSPGRRGWAFQYWDPLDASKLWEKIEDDTDIVITHTPAYGHVDTAEPGDKAGCPILLEKLAKVRPKMHVCGHIHSGRGVERVRWKTSPPTDDTSPSLVESIEHWTDPGAGNKKISLLDLTCKTGRGLENDVRALPRHVLPGSLRDLFEGPDTQSEGPLPDADMHNSTSSLETSALHQHNNEAPWRRKRGGAMQYTGCSDVGCGEVDAVGKVETAMINAVFMGPRIPSKAMEFSKPIVVDVELPVWNFSTDNEEHVQ